MLLFFPLRLFSIGVEISQGDFLLVSQDKMICKKHENDLFANNQCLYCLRQHLNLSVTMYPRIYPSTEHSPVMWLHLGLIHARNKDGTINEFEINDLALAWIFVKDDYERLSELRVYKFYDGIGCWQSDMANSLKPVMVWGIFL